MWVLPACPVFLRSDKNKFEVKPNSNQTNRPLIKSDPTTSSSTFDISALTYILILLRFLLFEWPYSYKTVFGKKGNGKVNYIEFSNSVRTIVLSSSLRHVTEPFSIPFPTVFIRLPGKGITRSNVVKLSILRLFFNRISP